MNQESSYLVGRHLLIFLTKTFRVQVSHPQLSNYKIKSYENEIQNLKL